MKYLLFLLLLPYGEASMAQCNIESSFGQYSVGNCGDVTIQSFLGTSIALYGSCGTIQISPPLGDGVVISGTSEIESAQLIISPNPSLGIINVRSHSAIRGIEVYTTLGQLVYRSEEDFFERQFDFTQLRDGLYLVKIQLANHQTHVITGTIIISR